GVRLRARAPLCDHPAGELAAIDHALFLVGPSRAKPAGPLAVQSAPLAVGRRLQLGDVLGCDFAVKVIQAAAIPAAHLARTYGRRGDALPRVLREQDLLGGVLAESAQPEDRQQRVSIREAHEKPMHTSLQRLIAEMIDERRSDVL